MWQKIQLPPPHLFVILLECCQILTCLGELAFFHTFTYVMMHKGTLRIPWRLCSAGGGHTIAAELFTCSPTNAATLCPKNFLIKQQKYSVRLAHCLRMLVSCGKSLHHKFRGQSQIHIHICSVTHIVYTFLFLHTSFCPPEQTLTSARIALPCLQVCLVTNRSIQAYLGHPSVPVGHRRARLHLRAISPTGI